MAKIRPRDSVVARSFSQLSITMYNPAKQKPAIPRNNAQKISSTIMMWARDAADAMAVSAA